MAIKNPSIHQFKQISELHFSSTQFILELISFFILKLISFFANSNRMYESFPSGTMKF